MVLLAGVTARAETLESLTAEALRNNPELRAFEAGIASAKGGVRTARVFANPELSVAPGVRRTDADKRAAQRFSRQFRTEPALRISRQAGAENCHRGKECRIAANRPGRFPFALAAKVRRAFYELLAAQKVTALRRDQVESAKTFVESARKRAESGYASDFETVKSQAELIAASAALLDAQGKVAAARVTLNTFGSVGADCSFGDRVRSRRSGPTQHARLNSSRSRWPAIRACARSACRPRPPV